MLYYEWIGINDAIDPAISNNIEECRIYQKPFFPDNFRTYNMNNTPKNNILMSGNIRKKD